MVATPSSHQPQPAQPQLNPFHMQADYAPAEAGQLGAQPGESGSGGGVSGGRGGGGGGNYQTFGGYEAEPAEYGAGRGGNTLNGTGSGSAARLSEAAMGGGAGPSGDAEAEQNVEAMVFNLKQRFKQSGVTLPLEKQSGARCPAVPRAAASAASVLLVRARSSILTSAWIAFRRSPLRAHLRRGGLPSGLPQAAALCAQQPPHGARGLQLHRFPRVPQQGCLLMPAGPPWPSQNAWRGSSVDPRRPQRCAQSARIHVCDRSTRAARL